MRFTCLRYRTSAASLARLGHWDGEPRITPMTRMAYTRFLVRHSRHWRNSRLAFRWRRGWRLGQRGDGSKKEAERKNKCTHIAGKDIRFGVESDHLVSPSVGRLTWDPYMGHPNEFLLGSCRSHQFTKQRRGVLVDVDALSATTVATGFTQCGFHG